MASSDAVDSMKPELWAEGKKTESWLLFSEGKSSRSRLTEGGGARLQRGEDGQGQSSLRHQGGQGGDRGGGPVHQALGERHHHGDGGGARVLWPLDQS